MTEAEIEKIIYDDFDLFSTYMDFLPQGGNYTQEELKEIHRMFVEGAIEAGTIEV